MVVETVINFIAGLGPGAVAVLALFVVFALVGAVKEWWVWGSTFAREREEKVYWRKLALDHLGLSEQAVEVAEEVLVTNGT